jgi:hypothetical protein
MKISEYLTLLDDSEQRLADVLELLAVRHATDPEVRDTARHLAQWSSEKRIALAPSLKRYGRGRLDASRLRDALLHRAPFGGFGLLRDLHDVDILAHHVYVCWVAVEKAAEALFDAELVALGKQELLRTERQARWLRTMIKTTAPQALTVAGDKLSEVRASVPLESRQLRLLAAVGGSVAVLAVAGVALVRQWRR